MGGLFSKPKINVNEQKPAPTMDDDAVRKAGDAEARRQAARRDTADTILTTPLTKRSGGLAAAYRKTIGGGS
ncbi:hypothetical protein ATO8_19864 [Roseivivax marinus]|uniref:Uncharacterized protein n=1 Tax=Roseivivax marinus TaxID=1379903 RepID=W4HET4_9RHOB|nr:hypothetical protein [Roseivivax marinus]ETW10888.1 hypothetical protein ATO8_19864 [Roseivivax marinus]